MNGEGLVSQAAGRIGERRGDVVSKSEKEDANG